MTDSSLDFPVSQNRLKQIIGTMSEVLVVVNEQQIIQQVNQAACKLFGYAANELVGQPFAMLLLDPTRALDDGFEFLPEDDQI